jgi:hypothetical protein
LVLDAAAMLDIREFDLFALAHSWRFGRRAEVAALERIFAYMFGGVTPAWVRQYAQRVLNPSRLRPPNSPRHGRAGPGPGAAAPRHGRLIVGLTFAVFGLIYLGLLETAANWPASATAEPGPRAAAALSCQGGGPGLAFFESLAFALSGRDPPTCD